MKLEERKDCVIALITSYNPDEGLEQLVLSILKENIISKVLIYDNNTGITGKSVLGNIEKYTDRIIVHYSATNDGLGTAYNTLINNYWSGENFIITFDQDSRIQSNFITDLYTTLRKEHAKDSRVVSIGPRIVLEGSEKSSKVTDKEDKKKLILITSGNLFFYDAFQKVQGFDESYFIDCLDYEFCLRLRKHGYRLIQNRKVLLYQNIGEEREGERMHSDFRMYYMIRNHIRLAKTYFFRFPFYILLENLLFLNYLNKWRKYSSREDVRAIVLKAIKEA